MSGEYVIKKQSVSVSNTGPATNSNNPPSGGVQQQPHQPSFSKYLATLKSDYANPQKRVFVFYEIMFGNFMLQLSKTHRLFAPINLYFNSYVQKGVLKIMNYLVKKVPRIFQTLVISMFIPVLLLITINQYILSPNCQTSTPSLLIDLNTTLIILYLLILLIGPGNLVTRQNKLYTLETIEQKPSYNHAATICQKCQILRGLRSAHCADCNKCIPKYSKHSIVFNQCIGASNELLYLVFLVVLETSLIWTLIGFVGMQGEGMGLVRIVARWVFGVVNVYLLWMAGVEAVSIFGLNFYWNITEYQLTNWRKVSYLIDYTNPNSFSNPLNIGLWNNLKESLFALLGTPSQSPKTNPLKQKNYITNWSRSLLKNNAQLINHPYHQQIVPRILEYEVKIGNDLKRNQKIKEDVFERWKGRKDMRQILEIVKGEVGAVMKREYEEMMRRREEGMKEQVRKEKERLEGFGKQSGKILEQTQSNTQQLKQQ